LRPRAAFVRGLVGIHVPSSWYANLSRARRPARRGRRPYRDHGRNPRRGEGALGHWHERGRPFRRFGSGARSRTARPLPSHQGQAARCRDNHRDGSVRVPPPCRGGVWGDHDARERRNGRRRADCAGAGEDGRSRPRYRAAAAFRRLSSKPSGWSGWGASSSRLGPSWTWDLSP
jgi:hypothetical protein